jgi:hypothetical protein
MDDFPFVNLNSGLKTEDKELALSPASNWVTFMLVM